MSWVVMPWQNAAFKRNDEVKCTQEIQIKIMTAPQI